MAEDILGKAVRIDDKQFNPKGAKFEVWTKRRHKYIKWYRDIGGPSAVPTISTEYYIDGDKISASLTDDEVIKAWLSHREAVAKFRSDIQVYKVIQDPYSDDEPVTKRVYGDGKSPYYLNNGCSINIEWRGQKPNPDFILGTFSNPEDAEDYYRKSTNGVRNGPDRFLRTTDENPVILTSSVDDATDGSKLPTSSWVVETPFIVGIDIDQPEMSEPNYRDKSTVNDKVVTVNLPKGFTENGGKGYLAWTDGGLQYDSKSIPHNTPFEMMYIDSRGYGMGGRPRDQIVYFYRNNKDSDIVSDVIEKFKSMVTDLHGISRNDYDLKLCSPDSEACKLIDYKSPLEASNKTPQQAAVSDTPPGPSQSNTKIKLSIQGLFDSGDGTTPGSTSSVFEIKAKTDMPTFTIWTGKIPKTEEIDVFDDLQELDDEYTEGDYKGEEETGLTLEVWKVQDDISNGQQDSDSNNGTVGDPADIKPVSNFDQLINLAGKCARELGKNGRVNAENMKKGYTKGIHGLCPQGTQAVLYALTGIKAVGSISGNADNFSFGPTNPSSSKTSSFSATGYYNDKTKVTQINGSWKGTYLTDKSKWQVGDVIAMAYTGKDYGHIQVYTGYCWMSDFKQNAIQQNHVNPNSVALWRLNEKGIAAVKKQSGTTA
jgi:hypothetical protein